MCFTNNYKDMYINIITLGINTRPLGPICHFIPSKCKSSLRIAFYIVYIVCTFMLDIKFKKSVWES